MKRIFSFILIFVAVFAVASCGEEKKKDVVKEKVAKEITADEGGTVSTSDESVAVDIPADALDSNTTITVSVYESSHYSTAKGEKVVSTVVEFEPSGTVFKKPIIIKMTANNEIKDSVVAAAVYNEAKGAWSYSEHSAYAVLVGRDAAGDPIMQTAAGDPIMLNAAGDPIMQSTGEGLAAAGDPIMLASAGDPIMTNAAGDPIMNAAAGDPIMMTTGHFTAYTFIEIVKESDSPADTGDADADTNDGDEDGIPDEDNATECGNGVVEEGEECDNGENNGKTDCAYGEKSCKVCTTECKESEGKVAYCGDGTKQGNEACDKADPKYGKGEGIGASCSDDCQIATVSCGTLPENAQWVNGDTYESTLNGEEYSSASAHYAESGDCAYKCKSTFSWIDSSCKCTNEQHVENGACASNTQAAASCGTLPANAQWVNGDTYIPTWNGTAYSSATANYAESGDCAYQCKSTFSWIDSSCKCTNEQHVENGACKSNTGNTENCTNLPDNAEWNNSAYTPHWSNGAWSTEPAATYFEEGGSECTYKCVSNFHYEDGNCKSDTKPAESCGTLPANAEWVNGNTYIPTWYGEGYTSASANYAQEGDCAFTCKQTFEWVETNGTCACPAEQHVENSVCVSDTGDTENCTNLPDNAEWHDSAYTPHWSNGAWSTEPAATYFEDGGSECTYKCVSDFHYEDGNCQSDTKPAVSCGTLPANAEWVNGNTYIPTWYGEGYTSASANYAQEGDCAFTCKQTFEWVETNGTCACPAEQHVENGVCVSDTGDTENCTNLPDNAEWHDSAYTPHWSNGAWSTEPAATYFEDGGSECTYKCISDFHYEDGICQSDTKPAVSCGTLPENAEWVNGNTYIPTWYGEGYTSASANHAEEGDCAYRCKSTYSWIETHEICACTDEEHVENGLCKSNTGEAQNCTNLPEHAAWVAAKYTPFWIDEAWSSEPAATYYEEEGEECTFECVENYHYEDGSCLSDTHPAESCGDLPENAEWVNGDTYIPTWNGEEYTSASANHAEEGDCAYRCKSTFEWVETNGTCACPAQQHVENGSCKSNTGEAQNCMNLPANAAWAVATYTPHWNGEEWTGEPEATYYEEEGEECTYTCAADYHYEDESCQSDTKPAESCGDLPENAEWVQGSTYIPTWNGKGYPYATAHYAEEGDCAFVCVEDYEWNFDTVECEPEPYCGDGIVQREDCSDFDENCVEREGLNEECDRESENGEITRCEYGETECTVCTFECAEVPGETSYCGDGKVDVENEEVCDKADPSVGEGEGIGSKCSDDCMEIIEVKKVLCTGQTKCYNDEGSVIDCPLEGEEFYGQDASYTARQSCTPQTYEKIAEGNGRSIVDDLSTGLRWYISSNGGNWNQAYDFCDTLDTGDGREWRLPTAKELMSIIDSGSSYPAVREAYFRSVFSSFNSYWSANYFLNSKTGEDEVLIMDVGYGHLSYDSYGKEEGSNNFACVSGDEYGVSGTFTTQNISGGTVVTDSATELMWKAADNLNMTWEQALAYCENLDYAGFDDWRLPNRNEFATLLNYDKEHGESKSNFEDIIEGNYWTSTFAATYGGSAGAFIIDVGLGTMVAVGDTGVDTAYTLCVRSDVAQYSAVPACDESGYTPCEDPETGIVWSQDVNDSDDEIDYIEAAMMCRESKQGGISQWRVATISEIRTILRSDVLDECHVSDECSELENEDCYDSEICATGTAIETVFRDYTFMVSGTQTDEGEGYSWRVNFKTGAIESHQGEYIYVTPSIRCVKDNSIPNVEFPYTDNENSLVWSELSADKLSWDEANEYCTEDEEYAWRLPTIEELATLVMGCHDGGCAPDIYGAYSVFGDVSTLWSSTVIRNQLPTNVETYYNVLDFMTASQTELTADAIRNFYAKVRCVADVDENPSPCDLYPCEDIENSDGTCSETLDGGYICGCDEGYEWDGEECWATEPDFPECSPESEFPCIDSEYELVWSAKSSDEMNWDDAGSYCENLTEGGYDDWRLPTIDELRTVIQNCSGSQIGGACAISDPDHLSNSDFSNDCYCDSMGSNNGYYSRLGDDDLVSLWSSSTTSGNTDRAWRVGFDDAYVYGYNKSGNNYVRCVREAFLGV